MMAEAGGAAYIAYPSLEQALADPDAALIMEADDGGQVLLTCPASAIHCSSAALENLLVDLDQISWSGNPPDMRRLVFEHRPVGSGVAGGMGGGVVGDDVWVHPEFEKLLLRDGSTTVAAAARDVISGATPRLPPPPYQTQR